MLRRLLKTITRPKQGRPKSISEIFTDIYHTNYWRGEGSRSGSGSELNQTEEIRRQLPPLIEELGVSTMLDVACGDFHWMKELELGADYIGADVVTEMITRNQAEYGNEQRRFTTLDVTKDHLPRVDLVFCRDALVHFPAESLFAALDNLKRSGSKYLLTTTFTTRSENPDIDWGLWRPLNLQKVPFEFPEPLKIINEKCTEGNGAWEDKSLGLWRLQDL